MAVVEDLMEAEEDSTVEEADSTAGVVDLMAVGVDSDLQTSRAIVAAIEVP